MTKAEKALARFDADIDAALARLAALVAIPSISPDPAYGDACQKAAEWLGRDVETLGFSIKIHQTSGHPILTAHRPAPGKPHILFYGHYDVMPVDPLEAWETEPFTLTRTMRDGREVLAGRGAVDDKGQVMSFIEAVRALIGSGEMPDIAISLLIEGEEEMGSANLLDFVAETYPGQEIDAVLVCDTNMWDRDTPAIITGLRGLLGEEVRVRAGAHDLHSGAFGGIAQNAIHALAGVIAGLRDENGRIAIPGFHYGVEAVDAATLPQQDGAALLAQVGLANSIGETGFPMVVQNRYRPTLDVNGIWGGYAGVGPKGVIPAEAGAKVSFRLVAGQDPQAIRAAFREFVTAQLPADCSVEFNPLQASSAFRANPESAIVRLAAEALEAEWGKAPIRVGAGYSIPVLNTFTDALGADVLLMGFGLDDDCTHAPNEKYDLRSFTSGTRSWIRLLAKIPRLRD